MSNTHTHKTAANPVVASIALRTYPGWIVRRYEDGVHDATNGLGLTPGLETFADVITFIREHQS